MAAQSARATIYVFDPGLSATSGTDGTGNWDTTTSNWFNTSGGTNPQVWSNSTADTAQFGVGGTAGTVSVATGVNVGTINFNAVSGSYTLAGGSLNWGTPGGHAYANVAGGVTATISSAITTGSTTSGAAFDMGGGGQLTLTGANTFTGFSTIDSGMLILSGNVTDTSNKSEFAVGGSLSPAGTSLTPNAAAVTVASGTTLNAGGQNVGLGNTDNSGSTTAYQQLSLNVNGTLTTSSILFTEYATAQNTTAAINVGSGGSISASYFGLGQSAGTTTVLTVNAGGSLVTTSTGTGDYLGEAAGTNTTLINNGTVTANFTLYTNQNGGTSTGVANIVNNGTLTVNNGYNLRLAGVTNLTNNGTLSANALFFGNAGGTYTETLNITGGTMTLAARSDLNSDASGTGTVNINISGGTFTDPAYPYLSLVAGQTTTVTQTGGVFNNPSTSGTDGLFFNNGLATYNLAGGMLKTNNVGTSGSPTSGSKFIFNGGTLQAQINSTLGGGFFSPPAAVIGPGGGTIDTQAFNVSAVTALTTGVTGGLDGGLTKLGSGTLSMKGSNTYTGPTAVSGGTLAMTGSGSINGSSVINIDGTGAKLLQLSSAAVTTPVVLTNGTIDGTTTVGAVTVGNGTGGIVANGNGSSGTFTIGSLGFLGAGNGNLFVSSADLAANNTAPINVLGTLSSTSAGKVTLNFTSVVTPGSTYDLFKYNAFSGDVSGSTPTDFNIGSGISGRAAGSSSLVLTSTTGPGYLELIVGSADNNIRWTGAADNTWTTSQASPTNWGYVNASSGAQTPFFNGDNVTFDDTGANTNPINISAGNVSPASMTFNNSSAVYTITSSGGYGITGAGSLVKNGTGLLVMNTTNSYTGGNTINAGTLDIGNAAGLGVGGALTIGNGSGGIVTIDNTSGAGITLTDSSLAINSDFTFVGSSNLSTGAGLVTLSGNRTITVSGNTLIIPAVISGSASLTKAGAGTLNLSASNTFNNGGGATVNAGTLNLMAGGAVGTLSGPLTINSGTVNAVAGDSLGYTIGSSTTPLTVNANGIFNLQAAGNNGFYTNLILNGGMVTGVNALGNASGGVFNFAPGYGITTVASAAQSNISTGINLRDAGTAVNSFVLNVAQGTSSSGVDLLISGVIIGDGGATLNKLGAGTLTLTNHNTYPGGTNVTAGTVNLNIGGAVGTVVGPLTISGSSTIVNANAQDAIGYNTAGAVPTLAVSNGGTFNINIAPTASTSFTTGNEGYLTNVVLTGGNIIGTALSPDSAAVPGRFNFYVSGGYGITTLPSGITSNISSGIQIRGGGALSINASSGSVSGNGVDLLISGQIVEAEGAGSISKFGTGTLDLAGSNTYSGGTNVFAGTIVGGNSAAFGNPNLNVNIYNGATLVLGSLSSPAPAVNFYQNYFDFGNFNGSSGSATLQLAPTANYSSGTVGIIEIQTGTRLALTLGSAPAAGVTSGLLTVSQLSLDDPTNTSTLDIGRVALDLPGASLSTITSYVATAYIKGTWTGPGITSSASATDSRHLTAVGAIVNDNGSGTPLYGNGGSISSTFEGGAPSDGDVLVKYTYYGDTDLNGEVDGSDYSRIDAAFVNNQNSSNTQLTGWFNGDFNYDGVIDGSDYALIDNSYNTQGAAISAELASPTALVAGTAAVPEPASLGLLVIGVSGLIGRRRRRK